MGTQEAHPGRSGGSKPHGLQRLGVWLSDHLSEIDKAPCPMWREYRAGGLCQLRGQKSGEMWLPATRYTDHFSQPGAGGDTVGNYLRGRFVMTVCACVRVIRAALTIHGGGGFRFRGCARLPNGSGATGPDQPRNDPRSVRLKETEVEREHDGRQTIDQGVAQEEQRD